MAKMTLKREAGTLTGIVEERNCVLIVQKVCVLDVAVLKIEERRRHLCTLSESTLPHLIMIKSTFRLKRRRRSLLLVRDAVVLVTLPHAAMPRNMSTDFLLMMEATGTKMSLRMTLSVIYVAEMTLKR